jgi:hypothetical protein
MIRREDEHLCLAGQSAERRRMQDAVPVTLEAGAPGVGLLGDGPVTGIRGAGGTRCEKGCLELEAFESIAWPERGGGVQWPALWWRPDAGVGVCVGQAHRPRIARHGGGPTGAALGLTRFERLTRSGRTTRLRRFLHVVQSARCL